MGETIEDLPIVGNPREGVHGVLALSLVDFWSLCLQS